MASFSRSSTTDMTASGLLALLFVLKLLATTDQPRLRRLGRHILAVALSRRDARRGLRVASRPPCPHAGLTMPSAAIVGMAAMVGAGTGGVMTAIVMIFEMTRDYAIIVPGDRRGRGRRGRAAGADRRDDLYDQAAPPRPRIPKERHVNLYLVQQAKDVMERNSRWRRRGPRCEDALVADVGDDLRAIVVERDGRHRRPRAAALGLVARADE